MVRTSRSISRTAAHLAAGGEPPDRAGGPAAPVTPPGQPHAHPLFVTADPDLLDDLLRLAALAGVTPDVAPDPAGARDRFGQADRVYVGADMAEPCARARLPRRSGVVVVMRQDASDLTRPADGSVRRGAWADRADVADTGDASWLESGLGRSGLGVHAGLRGRSVAGGRSVVGGRSVAGGWPGAGGRFEVGVDSGASGRLDIASRSDVGGPPTADWEAVHRLGADHVAVLPAAEPWLVEQLAATRPIAVQTAFATGISAERSPAEPTMAADGPGTAGAADSLTDIEALDTHAGGPVVAVLGGRGGAGASVLAGALAVTAARRGLRTLLVDADPLGGGVDLVLGWESLDGLRWPALSQASGEVPAPALVEALPGRSELVILSWDHGEPMTVPPEAMLAALDAGRRGRDLTVVDLPRRLDESSMLALRAADQVYLVVPAELRACAAAARVAAVVGPHCAALSVVVRQPGPAGLAVKEVVAALRLPHAGTVRSEPRLRTAWERGEPPAATGRGSLATLCEKLLDDLGPAGSVVDGAAPASREGSA